LLQRAVRRLWRQSFDELPANFFGLLPAVGTGALENEPAIERSPNPFEAAAAAPGLVIGVLTVRMMAGIDREHFDPDFSEILLSSPNWGKTLSATVQFDSDFSVRISKLLKNKQLGYGGGGGSRTGHSR
jgi:hypothetical protein